MFFELLLLSVAAMAGWQGLVVATKGSGERRTYAFMLLADALLAGWTWSLERAEGNADAEVGSLLGAVAIGAFVFLVFVPTLLRSLTRRALAFGRPGIALRLLGLRELLQPGMGARLDRDLLSLDLVVRAGRVDDALVELRRRRVHASSHPRLRQLLDERITLTLLFARRFREALGYYERAFEPVPGGVSPPLYVEVLRAYGEEGELAQVATMLDRLERSPLAEEPALAVLVARARLIFLAFVGRPVEVEALVAASGPLAILSLAGRAYWLGVARFHAGDAAGARTAFAEAVGHASTDEQSRRVAEARLADAGSAAVRVLEPDVAALAERVIARIAAGEPAGRAVEPRLLGVRAKDVPVTVGIVAANLAVAMLLALALGPSEDPGVLAEAGANLRVAVLAGEWWRLPASTLLHVGVLHLAVNMYGLWVLGRLVEQLFGRARFFVIYSMAGLGGALASLLLGAAGISAGASGAVMGVLGAGIAELALRGRSGRAPWRRPLLANLIFIAVANLVIGNLYEAIDQAAHVGGLVTGACFALLLSPSGLLGRSRVAGVVTLLLVGLSVGSVAYAALGVATTRYADTIARVGWTRSVLGGVSLEAPRAWIGVAKPRGVSDGELLDPTFVRGPVLVVIAGPLGAESPTATAAALRTQHRAFFEQSKEVREVAEIDAAMALPAGWSAAALRISFAMPWGHAWYRRVFLVQAVGDDGIVVVLLYPESRHALMAPLVPRILGSARIVD
ncbi:MAG: rhomboid family intramembrane serine protease [Myxococcales bacterium]|nr:rhomboid family intramembrane serine protease [Myxococcales bacterium]